MIMCFSSYSHKSTTWIGLNLAKIECILNTGTKKIHPVINNATESWFFASYELTIFIATISQHSVDIATQYWFDLIATLFKIISPKNLRVLIKNRKSMPLLLHQYHIATANIATKEQHKVKTWHLHPHSHKKLRSLVLKRKCNNLYWVSLFLVIATFLPLLWLKM